MPAEGSPDRSAVTILLPVTRDWTRHAFCAALSASDVPRGRLILVLDAPGCEQWAPSLRALGFDVELHETGNGAPPEVAATGRRPRQEEMLELTTRLVPDGSLLRLDDDTVVPPDVFARLSAAGPHATGIQVSRHGGTWCGVWRSGRPLKSGRGVEDVESCGHYCILTTGEMYRRAAVPLPGTGQMRPIPGLKADWGCVCGHLTREGVLMPSGSRGRLTKVSKPPSIAVCIPTRGIVFTEVMAGVFGNLAGRQAHLLTTIDQGLPECMNDLVERALATGASHIWVVEEDTVPPAGVLDRMLAEDVDYIACDYPVGNGHTCFGFDDDGLLWTGMGCTLIRADVFRRVKRPWFECNMNMVVARRNGLDYFTADHRTVNHRGGHDLSFCSKLKKLGIPVRGLHGDECRHLKMKAWNIRPTNHACHAIEPVPAIREGWEEYLAGAPRCAIVIPCYNHGRYLAEAISSALAQTVPCEVIVVDDGSTDETAAVVRRYPGVTLIRQKNRGLAAARNAGIRAAHAAQILPLDADDVLKPDCVDRMLSASSGGLVRACARLFGDVERTWMPGGDLTLAGFMEANRAAACSLFPREAWEEVGGYDESMRDGYEDWDFHVRLLFAGYPLATVREICWLYRKHGDSLVTHAKTNGDAVVAYMRAKWARLGISGDSKPSMQGRATHRKEPPVSLFTLKTRVYETGPDGIRRLKHRAGKKIPMEEAERLGLAGRPHTTRTARPAVPDGAEAPAKSPSKMNHTELVEYAALVHVSHPAGATNKQIREAIKSAGK